MALMQAHNVLAKASMTTPSDISATIAPASTTSILHSEGPTRRNITIKCPNFTYLHLSLLSSAAPVTATSFSTRPSLDLLTARTYLASALQQHLGMTGSAISLDFIKVEGSEVWIRLPREDGAAVVAALSQWIGKDGTVSWRVKGRGDWLGSLVAGNGRELFEP
ncbi:MAG: hypothetical protein Q9163_003396 [Psora crenata]